MPEAAPDGDNGWAADAVLRWPGPVVFDRSGNLYVADAGNAKVRKITPGGLITTFAGTGEVGFSGDGGPASRAQIGADLTAWRLTQRQPLYLGCREQPDPEGVGNRRDDQHVRVWPRSAEGGGGGGFDGIAVDSAGNLYIAIRANT